MLFSTVYVIYFVESHILVYAPFLLTGRDLKNAEGSCEEASDEKETGVLICENSSVFPSIPLAINWLRESVRKNQSVRFQVLLSGHHLLCRR